MAAQGYYVPAIIVAMIAINMHSILTTAVVETAGEDSKVDQSETIITRRQEQSLPIKDGIPHYKILSQSSMELDHGKPQVTVKADDQSSTGFKTSYQVIFMPKGKQQQSTLPEDVRPGFTRTYEVIDLSKSQPEQSSSKQRIRGLFPPILQPQTSEQFNRGGTKIYEVISMTRSERGKTPIKECDDEDDCESPYSGEGKDEHDQRIKGLSPPKEGSPLPRDIESDDQLTDGIKRTYIVDALDPGHKFGETFEAGVEPGRTPKYKEISTSLIQPELTPEDCDDEEDCKPSYSGSGDETNEIDGSKKPDRVKGLSPTKEEPAWWKNIFGVNEKPNEGKPRYKDVSSSLFEPQEREDSHEDADDVTSYKFPDKVKGYSPGIYEVQKDDSLTAASFVTKSSYRVFPPLGETTADYTDVEMSVRPAKLTGILLYNGWKHGSVGDFIALTLKQGFVELSFNCGSGATHIRSLKAIELGKWHNIRFYRSERLGRLVVDSGVPSMGFSPGPHTLMSLHENLYIGGVDDSMKHEVTENLGMHMSFAGYIRKLKINEEPLTLNLLGNSVNEQHDPCSIKPCKNGGQCANDGKQYFCSCTPYYTGKDCEKQINLDAIRFKPQSYIIVNKSVFLKSLWLPNNSVSFFIKTKDLNGLVLLEMQTGDGNHTYYVAVSVHGGTILLSYDVGFGKIVLLSRARIDDGHWHKVTIASGETSCGIEIDDKHRKEFTLIEFNYQNVPNVDFCIGAPLKITESLNSLFHSGFSGCLKEFLVNNEYLDFVGDAVEAKDIEDCSNN